MSGGVANRPASFIVALAVALVASCSPSGSDRGQTTSTVLSAMPVDPASLSLLGKADRWTEIVAAQITDSLVQFDAELRLRPRVAESWQFSSDRREVTFQLREGVRWHDGAPVTADDVVFSLEKLREPATENQVYAPAFKNLESVSAPDSRTVVARYREATPSDLEAWRFPLIPRHVAGRDADLLTGEFARAPIGCGPFRLVRYTPGVELVLEAFDDYWDGRPSIDRLVLRIYPDLRTSYQALLRGDLDVLTVSSDQWATWRDEPGSARLDAFVYTVLSVWPVLWNQDGSNPFFTDVRVRRALVLALDRETFAATVAQGLARPGATAFHPDTAWAAPDVLPAPYDPQRAAQLLDEAGWRDSDGDGIRDRNGLPFRFSLLMPNSGMKLAEQIAVWQQHAWAEVGVRADIERMEWQTLRERRNAGDFEATSFSLSFTPGPDQFYDLFHSSAREEGVNWFGFADVEVDRLLEAGRASFDEAERLTIYHELQRRLAELEPILSTFYFSSPVLHDRRLLGITPSPLDIWRTTEGPRVWRWADDGPPAGS